MKRILASLTMVAVVFGLGMASASAAEEKEKPDRSKVFKRLDKDGDGKLTLVEFKGKKEGDALAKAEKAFARMDKDKDGTLSLEEFTAVRKKTDK